MTTAPAQRKTLHSVVSGVTQQTHDTKSFQVRLPEAFDFQPGQFLMLSLEDPGNPDLKGKQRAYSIASSPTTQEYVEVVIKETPNGFFSKYMVRDCREGEKVKFTGPWGHFVYNESMPGHLVLIGAGSGIAPLLAMMRYLTDKRLSNKATLFFSNKTREDVIYEKKLAELPRQNPNLRVVNTLTREEEGDDWKGERGRVSAEMIKKHIPDVHGALYYLCGPPLMVDGVVKMLKEELGVDPAKIKTEKYD
ncbi:MAG TPA: oxidoreductase [Candidatus Diapherotrites archaeon]|uniref:Oxidoreductase n=1 Tax=Candidatus Iainarchaeum sp. TaxID=3101447 RepID=A0A7J4JIH0_9ARCH|nr:oxidoreductase [Candidatus Diapherotrites archaeon]HIH16399.1 oxidoreductase [Candidatus Diapherotrites archaeon]